MALALGGDDLARSVSRRSFGGGSLQGVWQQEPDVFSSGGREDDDEADLRWAAIERLPTYNRMGKSLLKQVLEDGTVKASEIDVKKLGTDERRHLMSRILNAVEDDNERFLRRLRSRADR